MTVKCPKCGNRLGLSPDTIDRPANCPACGQRIVVRRRKPGTPDNAHVESGGRPQKPRDTLPPSRSKHVFVTGGLVIACAVGVVGVTWILLKWWIAPSARTSHEAPPQDLTRPSPSESDSDDYVEVKTVEAKVKRGEKVLVVVPRGSVFRALKRKDGWVMVEVLSGPVDDPDENAGPVDDPDENAEPIAGWVHSSCLKRCIKQVIIRGTPGQPTGPQSVQHARFALIHTFTPGLSGPGGLDFSPDGKLLAVRNPGGRIQVWDVQTHRSLRTFQTEGQGAVLFHPDGKRLILANGPAIDIVDAMTGARLRQLQSNDRVTKRVSLTADGRTLASSHYSSVCIWDLRAMSQLMAYPAEYVSGVVIAPDGSFFVYWIGNRAPLHRVGIPTGEELDNLNVGGYLSYFTSAAVSPDGQCLAASAMPSEAVLHWRLRTKDLSVLGKHNIKTTQDQQGTWVTIKGIRSVAFSPEGRRVLAGHSDGNVLLFEVPANRLVGESSEAAHSGSDVRTVRFSPDGKHAASGGDRGGVCLWNVPN